MKYFEGTQEEYLKAAANYKKKNNSLAGFTEKVGFFKNSEGETYKVRPKEGGRLSLANIKSYRGYQSKRSSAERPKTEGEAQYLTELKNQAKAQSESTEAQFVSGGKPLIAEHNVRLASGGSSEFMSISDPEFKVWKDTIEAKAASQFGDKVVVDIDNVSGDVRVIPSSIHNKFQPTSIQPGIDIPIGSNIEDSFKQVNNLLEQPISKLVEPLKNFDFSGGGVRLNAKNLAIAGLLSYGALGTAASAAETAQRTQIAQETGNPLDILQAGIAGVSTAADVAAYNPVTSLPAEVVSTAADVANVGIDVARNIDIGNELKYIGGQVRLGRLPYGLEQVASWAKSAF
jgi:hypothetical protein